MNDREIGRGERVTPLELFFDLVFVFAITQVTSLLAVDPTWTLIRGRRAALTPDEIAALERRGRPEPTGN